MHTDHGAQYTSRAFADACRLAGVRQSMSAVGSSADNAAAESFNATFKRETLKERKGWSSEREAPLDAFRWLSRYNTRRRHSRLGQRSPIAYDPTCGGVLRFRLTAFKVPERRPAGLGPHPPEAAMYQGRSSRLRPTSSPRRGATGMNQAGSSLLTEPAGVALLHRDRTMRTCVRPRATNYRS